MPYLESVGFCADSFRKLCHRIYDDELFFSHDADGEFSQEKRNTHLRKVPAEQEMFLGHLKFHKYVEISTFYKGESYQLVLSSADINDSAKSVLS